MAQKLQDFTKAFNKEIDSQFRRHLASDVKGVYAPFRVEGAVGISKNVKAAMDIVTAKSLMAAVQAAKRILRASQLRVPIDTGELKGSGTARIAGIPVAQGNRDKFSDQIRIIKTPHISDLLHKKHININVQYIRWNERGQDIAFWAHQDLNPYGSATSPKARTPNTGPKYLEIPFNMLKADTIAEIKESVRTIDEDIEKSKTIIAQENARLKAEKSRISAEKAWRRYIEKFMRE